MVNISTFQSHIDSIKAPHPFAEGVMLREFQSHIDSIKALCSATIEMRIPRFNPTLIRLRQDSLFDKSFSGVMFQSHIDSIKAGGYTFPDNNLIMFQSHIDSIKA